MRQALSRIRANPAPRTSSAETCTFPARVAPAREASLWIHDEASRRRGDRAPRGARRAADPARPRAAGGRARVVAFGDESTMLAESLEARRQIECCVKNATCSVRSFTSNELEGLVEGFLGRESPDYSPAPTCH